MPCHCGQRRETLRERGESSAVLCRIRVPYLLFKGWVHALHPPQTPPLGRERGAAMLWWGGVSPRLLSSETPTAAASSPAARSEAVHPHPSAELNFNTDPAV